MTAGFWFDLRQALRATSHRPGFAGAAILVLALGIGATTVIFSVGHGVLVRPLPYPDSERLFALWPDTAVNKLVADRSGDLESFSSVAANIPGLFSLTGDGEPLMVEGGSVGDRFFEVLGVDAALGRTFARGENRPGAEKVVVISHGLWTRRFGADPGIVGRSVDIGADPHEVIGVMPADFRPLSAGAEMWSPIVLDPADADDYRGSFYVRLIGRLEEGVDPRQAEAEVQQLALEVRSEFPNLMPDEKIEGARLQALQEHVVAGVRPTLLVLFGAALAVLLVAVSNVAGLMVARASGRQREIAMRAALGARAGRLFRQLLAESMILGGAGAVAGLLLATWGKEIMVRFLEVPRIAEVEVGGAVLAFCLLISLLAAVCASAAPLRFMTRLDVHRALRGGAATDGSRQRAGRGGLVVAQVAIATVLLVAAGLFVRSFSHLSAVDPGFSPEPLISFRVSPSAVRYADDGSKLEYFARVLEEVRALPAVESAGLVQTMPLTPYRWTLPYIAEDHPVPPGTPAGTALPDAEFRVVSPDYFDSLGVSLLEGRFFDARDSGDAAAVGLVNQTMASELWPDGDAVGKTLQLFGDGGPEFRVVGVVADVHQLRLDQAPRPEMFRPFAQWPLVSMYLTVRSSVEPLALLPDLRQTIWQVDPNVPLSEVRSGESLMREATGDERSVSMVIAVFAVVALTLGMVGVFAVVSFTVARRRRELGIRSALGAQRSDVIREVLRQGLALTGAGLLIGLIASVWVGITLESRLFEVRAFDGLTLGLVAALLGLAALASTAVPAVRASSVAPVEAIRKEG